MISSTKGCNSHFIFYHAHTHSERHALGVRILDLIEKLYFNLVCLSICIIIHLSVSFYLCIGYNILQTLSLSQASSQRYSCSMGGGEENASMLKIVHVPLATGENLVSQAFTVSLSHTHIHTHSRTLSLMTPFLKCVRK